MQYHLLGSVFRSVSHDTGPRSCPLSDCATFVHVQAPYMTIIINTCCFIAWSGCLNPSCGNHLPYFLIPTLLLRCRLFQRSWRLLWSTPESLLMFIHNDCWIYTRKSHKNLCNPEIVVSIPRSLSSHIVLHLPCFTMGLNWPSSLSACASLRAYFTLDLISTKVHLIASSPHLTVSNQ